MVEIKFACKSVASFPPFGHLNQVINASWEKSIKLSSTNEIQDLSALKWNFADFVLLQGNLHVHLATQCNYLPKFNLQLLATTGLCPFNLRALGNKFRSSLVRIALLSCIFFLHAQIKVLSAPVIKNHFLFFLQTLKVCLLYTLNDWQNFEHWFLSKGRLLWV